jgi:Bacterial PH domain
MQQIAIDLLTKKAAEELASKLLPGEVIKIAFPAQYGHAFGNVALTDKRVYFHGKSTKEETASIGLSKISQVKTELGGFFSSTYLTVEYSGGEVKLRMFDNDMCKALGDAVTFATL